MAETIKNAKKYYAGREPGIYFNLSNKDYHLDPALGSTDLRAAVRGAGVYWWNSYMNPMRPPVEKKKTDALLYGDATHKCILEGVEAFKKVYKRRPDDAPEASPADKGAATKRFKSKLMKGEEMLHGEDFDSVMLTGQMIRANPELQTAFEGGVSELAIFWREGPFMLKIKIDKLKPKGLGDLKTIANQMKRDLEEACRLEFCFRRHDMQALHYLDGAARIPDLLAAGKIFGEPNDSDMDVLHKFCKHNQHAFQFVYFQSEGVPETFSTYLSPDNPIFEFSRRDLDDGKERFRIAMERWGEETMWLTTRKVRELQIDDLPPSFARKSIDA